MLDGKKTLFSGMQATGNLTLGNYLGALKNWVTISDDYQTFFSVVDMHLLPVPCIGTCGAGLDLKLLYLYGRAEPDDPV